LYLLSIYKRSPLPYIKQRTGFRKKVWNSQSPRMTANGICWDGLSILIFHIKIRIPKRTNINQEATKMKQPLFLKPVFQERIWGGTALKENFGYDIPSEHTGECWAISGHPNGPSVVKNGPYAGKSLIELWDNHRELFGNYDSKVFPLLTKIL